MNLSRLADRLRLIVSRVVITLTNDSGRVQMAQVDGLSDETLDDVEVFSLWGLATRPRRKAEGIMVAVGGDRSHGLIIAVADRQYRLKNLAEGEVALYDDQDQVVYLKRDGLRIESPLKVEIEAPSVTVTANEATIDADTTEVTGDLSVGGDLTVSGQSTLGTGATKFVKLADNSNATTVKAL